MKRTGRAALAATGRVPASDGLAARATRSFEGTRTRGRDTLPVGPGRRACVDGAPSRSDPAAEQPAA